MDLSKIQKFNEDKANQELAATKHQETLAHADAVSNTVLIATESLIKYLEGHTTKTEVINQLESIHTPDIDGVIRAIEVLDTTVKNAPQTDLSGVISLMQELVTEARSLPKAFPSPQEFPQPIDNTKQLEALKDAIQAVEKVVKAQKLVAEAPVVNVPETNVHVDAPDLKPLQSGFKDVVAAVKAIVIPEYKTDNSGVEKLLQKTNKLLDDILDKPVASGGGGGSSWTAVGTNDLPAPLHVDTQGSLLTNPTPLASRLDDTTTPNIVYIGKATTGAAIGNPVWQIARLDTSSGLIKTWADGDSQFNNVWNDRATITYS